MWPKRREKVSRPRVGLALSGGAARGIAHVGVLKALARHQIPIDCVAGTSAGAIVGGAFASGMPLDEIEAIGRSLRWRDMGRVTLSRLGVQSNARLEEFMRARLPVSRFEEMPLKFAAIATDLQTGAAVVLKDEGDLAFAIRASCTIPGWYIPVTDAEGRTLVDGGLVANIPTAAVRSLGAQVVIAVDVNSEGAKFLGPPQSAIGVMVQSMMVIQRTIASHQLAAADVVIQPRVGHIRWDEISRAAEFIEAGLEAGEQAAEEIKRLIQPEPEPASKWSRILRRAKAPDEKGRRTTTRSAS